MIGIDDWAWRHGRRYGTVICDLERRRIVDILPDHEPATVEAWLERHPGIEFVARDRDGGYSRAVSRALPHAVQIADRWHLLDNAANAFLAAVRRSMPEIRAAFGSRIVAPTVLTKAEQLQYEGFMRRRQTNLEVRRMADDGLAIKRIVRRTGLSRNLVRQIIRGEREDIFRLRQSSLEPWLPWLTSEWGGGCRNGAELWRRLRAEGFKGSLRVVPEDRTVSARRVLARFVLKYTLSAGHPQLGGVDLDLAVEDDVFNSIRLTRMDDEFGSNGKSSVAAIC